MAFGPFSSCMRVDIYLKLSRLVPRRTVAQELCDASAILVNGVVAKSSKDVKIGDEIEIRRRNRILKVSVSAVPNVKQVSKDVAGQLYEVISDEAVTPEFP